MSENPSVDVRFFAGAAHAFGTQQRTVQADTFGALLAALRSDASEDARTVLSRSSFLLNSAACSDESAALSAGDRVDVLPPFAGG
ncbi:MoaD/ThiS family protein [Helcobacillus massiliensis]|uniref:Molybdopterin converting factor small subunit n=1 Tax=Helcobacillus massiliensis TaxID=521392 RepID=A0A839QTX0_9MICO|nr:MoaD/ThiS family protein [Helcobacillus massiliensis]MBB3023088.1 molybdopterin converting factor small subunit [Helcobacillus massiliensis]MDK7741469.1 MoaD/ThiS family protein [Helcobacillus massiliensis]WOO92409.1 MoaD/ThiS family protein [Helcobacillus massiliensis]